MPLARLEQHLASKYAASRVFTPETIKKAKVATGVTLAYVVHTSDGDTTDADTEVRVVLVTGYCNRQEEWAPTVDAMLTQWSVDWTGKRLKVLTLDNRGVGNSDAPWGAYSTAMLADDTLALADHLGWSAFHLVGASMGGMICQKMCLAAPDRIESLALLATARGTVLPGSQAYPALFKMMTAVSAHRQVDGMLSFLYPSSFLDQPNGDSGSTMRDVMTSYHTQVSVANAKPSVAGALGQTAAVTRHYVSDAELHRMRDRGYPILVVGTRLDLCISVEHAHELADALASDHTELFVFEDAGHGALLQHVDATAEKLLALFLRAKQAD